MAIPAKQANRAKQAKGTLRTRRERVEARERDIVAAAGDLFAQRDFDDVRVGEIARCAGVAEGTVYLYFESKAALLHAAVEQFYRSLTERAAAGVRRIRGTRKRLEFLAEHHVQSVIDHRRILFGIERSGATNGGDDQYRLNRTYVTVFDDVIREGVDREDIRKDIPLWLLRDLFYGSLEYSARTTMIHARGRDAKRAVRGLMQALEGGIILDRRVGTAVKHDRIADVAVRLEQIAERLEATSAKAVPRKAKRS